MTTYDWRNGNVRVSLNLSNGERTLTYPMNEGVAPTAPFNIDIRVQTACSFGFNPTTGKAICTFCHESARTDGKECDYSQLLSKLGALSRELSNNHAIELAIGCNSPTLELGTFLREVVRLQFIPNLTVNGGHLKTHLPTIQKWQQEGIVFGVGISYRKLFENQLALLQDKLNNVVLHCICGIDSVDDVLRMGKSNPQIRKLLILGEKDFGFNVGNVDISSPYHLEWKVRLREVLDAYEIVSFDNLALEQLNVRGTLGITDSEWNSRYQGEYSLYINAVEGYYSPSSRSNKRVSWDATSISEFFTSLL